MSTSEPGLGRTQAVVLELELGFISLAWMPPHFLHALYSPLILPGFIAENGFCSV